MAFNKLSFVDQVGYKRPIINLLWDYMKKNQFIKNILISLLTSESVTASCKILIFRIITNP